MHPYQDQIDKMWSLIKRLNLAKRSECWLEAINLSYILLEIELHLLFLSKVGTSGIQIPPREIGDQDYLMHLADLARDNKFIDEDLLKRIRDFNNLRKRAIHELIVGEISYDDLKEPALKSIELLGDIQKCWIELEWGPEESYEDFIKGKGNQKK